MSYDDETNTVVYCNCLLVKRLAPRLQELASAEFIARTPLYDQGAKPPIDRTKESLFIKGYWEDLRSHLRLALAAKTLDTDFRFHFHHFSDSTLLDVYLDKLSYKAQAHVERKKKDIFNTLDQFAGSDYDLVVMKIGCLGHKNIAMAGVILQTLRMREMALKRTWLIEDVSGTAFGPGNHSYSPELASYIAGRFKVLNLTRQQPPKVVMPQYGYDVPSGDKDSDDVSFGSAEDAFKGRPKEVFTAPPDPSVFEDVGALAGKKKGRKFH